VKFQYFFLAKSLTEPQPGSAGARTADAHKKLDFVVFSTGHFQNSFSFSAPQTN
jgi:hypothetical protein